MISSFNHHDIINIFSTWEHVVELCRLSFVVFETGLSYKMIPILHSIGFSISRGFLQL